MPSPKLFFSNPLSFWQTFPELRPNSRQGKLCFTNGCFDLIHPGHVQYLEDAKAYGDILVVGLNSDQSVARIKGQSRPLQSQTARALVLLGLRSVDAVICFDEDTPARLIEQLLPDVLIKGGDYVPDTVVGRDIVEKHGGQTIIIPFLEGYSTTAIVNRILTNTGVFGG
ncbi:MAG: D-glycero-beta-D-manno-heptose 1-phosphate adenylyltransferase [Holophagaceae bacterium]|nr:D-glycero-beta-D-manno-heptose 1-phosphate adenylyltransferase [Holophagaceae bacterium]